MFQKITKSVIKKLEEFGIKIADIDHPSVDEDIIFTGNSLVQCDNKNKSIDIAFHVGTKADEAARYILILNKLKNIDISVSDSFIYSKDGFLQGEDAYKIFEDIKNRQLIEGFLQTQALIKTPGYMGTIN